ncbi:MAG: SUMF1/EgtB/PvdO family nonheme iron enzyme [Planctomycetota bacterium]
MTARAAILSLLGLTSLLGMHAGQQQKDPLGEAREAVARTRSALDEARRRLEDDYRALEDAFVGLRDQGGRLFHEAVAERVDALFPGLKAVYEERKSQAAESTRRALGRQVVPELRRVLADSLQARPLTTSDLQSVLLDALAERLFESLWKGDDQPASAVGDAIRESIDPTRPFHEIWNERLYLLRPSARAFAEAYRAYIAAGTELDRLQNPDRFLPGGQRVRPGMVYVPGGSYLLGPSTGFQLERRRVNIRPLLLDRHEVTNAQYRVFLESLAPEQRAERLPSLWSLDSELRPSFPEELANHPVVGVTWPDADAYARWAGKRLPTEDEWEAAAAGTTRYLFPWGPDFLIGRCNSREAGHDGTVPVGTYPQGASPTGCEDMAGNVAEWTTTTDKGEAIDKLTNPLTSVVIRGGSFRRSADNVSTRFRWIAPGLRTRDETIGFRCAADLK